MVYLPYQFNLRENFILKNDGSYDYDIGIVNATPMVSDTVDAVLLTEEPVYITRGY